MSWILLGLISAVLLGFYDFCKKLALKDNAVLPTLIIATACGSALWAVPLLIHFIEPERLSGTLLEIEPLDPIGHLRIFLKALIVATSWVLSYFALKELPLSVAAPIRASGPVWTLIGAILIFSEAPSLGQWLGMLTAFAGYFLFSVVAKGEGIAFARNKWVLYMFLATLIGTGSTLYDKLLLSTYGYGPATVQAWFAVYLVVVLLPSLWLRRLFAKKKQPFHWHWAIPLIGISLILADYAYFDALHQEGSLVAILSVLRRSSVIVSFALAAAILGEQSIPKKAACLGIILLGIALILTS